MMGLGLVCLAPYLLFRVFFPHSFDVTAYSASVDYEFRDEELASEFAMLNLNAEWIKIGSVKITSADWRRLEEALKEEEQENEDSLPET